MKKEEFYRGWNDDEMMIMKTFEDDPDIFIRSKKFISFEKAITYAKTCEKTLLAIMEQDKADKVFGAFSDKFAKTEEKVFESNYVEEGCGNNFYAFYRMYHKGCTSPEQEIVYRVSLTYEYVEE